MTEQVPAGPSSPQKQDDHAKKRKRNTIACFQCRARKRRCTTDYVDICENCLREGLECRKPDMDGRKTRWKKGQTVTESSPLDTAGAPKAPGDSDEAYAGCLYSHAMVPNSSHNGDGSSRLSDRPNLSVGTGATAKSMAPPIRPAYSELEADHVNTELLQLPSPGNNLLWNGLFDNFQNYDFNAPDPFQAQRTSSSPGMSGQSNQVKKVVWWRFHGPSAIAPGLKRITLKVRLDDIVDQPSPTLPRLPSIQGNQFLQPSLDNIVDEDGMPRHDLMLHLLDVFMTHFGCQYPALSQTQLERDLNERSGSTLLFNCIASTASRFSKHPDIALPHLEPHAYGRIFHKTAKNMLGNVLAVPSRETVIALTLLAGISHGIDSESEEWMAAGMAVRMAIDLGLHLTTPEGSVMSEEERRLNRLTFWSVYFLDVALSFGVGRETAFRLAAITQTIPTESDFISTNAGTSDIGGFAAEIPIRKAFSYAARLAFAYGPLVNVVNGPRDDQQGWEAQAQQITEQAVEVYNTLPLDMQWSAYNLQSFSQAGQGPIFVQMHLWMHTILASGYLIGTDVLRPDRKTHIHGNATPSNTTASRLWQHSARTIGDILIMSDIVNPFVYHALPFSNQPFVVAGCCYIKDADSQLQRSIFNGNVNTLGSAFGDNVPSAAQGPSNQSTDKTGNGEKAEMFRTLLQSVTSNNITALRQGLVRQTRYWAGVAWVAEVLAQRMSGISMADIDLKAVTEGLDSTVAVADARMFARADDDHVTKQQQIGSSTGWPDVQSSLEADWLADTTFLQSQGYPVVVEDFTSDWTNYA